MIQLNGIYVVNPAYKLKNDINKILFYLCPLESSLDAEDFFSYIHPLNAQLLSFFNGKDALQVILDKASGLFGLSKTELLGIISGFIENTEHRAIKYNAYTMYFPKFTLVKASMVSKFRVYDIDSFKLYEDIDFSSVRLMRPLSFLLLLTMDCYTNCMYCYANRKLGNGYMTLEQYKAIIREAKELDIDNISVNGGEVLLHPYCFEILTELLNSGYTPMISTKMPLSRSIILKLKEIGIRSIQLSLDSVNIETLDTLLSIDSSYFLDMDRTINDLDREGFDITIHAVLCAQNTSIEKLSELIEYITKYANVKNITFSPAGFSLYRGNYEKYCPRLDVIEEVRCFVESYNGNLLEGKPKIKMDSFFTEDYFKNNESFNKRAVCPANLRDFVVLPDGRVTICEQLYDHPRFIIGDLTKQSIVEVWNSKEANALYDLRQDQINKESQCSDCTDFITCRKKRGICWKHVLMAYGRDNWDYPDPKCPKAPRFKRRFYIK